MRFRPFRRPYAVVACLIAMLSTAAVQAESYLSDPSVSFGRHLPDNRDAAFYRWADPVRGAPQNLGAGQWVLETDRKTLLPYPRLTALTDGASVTKANTALEAMHGRILKMAYQTNSILIHTRFGKSAARWSTLRAGRSSRSSHAMTSGTVHSSLLGRY